MNQIELRVGRCVLGAGVDGDNLGIGGYRWDIYDDHRDGGIGGKGVGLRLFWIAIWAGRVNA